MSATLTIEKVEAMFIVANIKVNKIYVLHNLYIGKVLNKFDAQYSFDHPWFLVSTEYGNIILGPRGRDFTLKWDETKLREKLPQDEDQEYIQSGNTYVHTHTEEALGLNIKKLGEVLRQL